MVEAVMIGAGQRGYEVYGKYALENKDKLKFVAVAEPDEKKRERFAREHGISDEFCFSHYNELLEKELLAKAAFICTQDKAHVEPTVAALKKGYHVLLEKPMATTAEECLQMGKIAEEQNRILSISHVLRFSFFFAKLKEIVESGKIGEVVNIKHAENVAFWHQAHSFVRGNWRNSDLASPMILQKCCHDMDIILWLVNKDCIKVSSFGSLMYFNEKNAPSGATERCTDDCPHKATCEYNAEKIYLTENVGWPASVISVDKSLEARTKALQEGPYGRCVYKCDNNVVDHQVTILEFEGGTTATLTMCAFTNECTRKIEIMGTKGEIVGHMNDKIEVVSFVTGEREEISVNDVKHLTGHGGGDALLTEAFVKQVEDSMLDGINSAKRSIQSHLMSLAAERSRVLGRVVSIDEFYSEN